MKPVTAAVSTSVKTRDPDWTALFYYRRMRMTACIHDNISAIAYGARLKDTSALEHGVLTASPGVLRGKTNNIFQSSENIFRNE